jgi:hypothetical protein
LPIYLVLKKDKKYWENLLINNEIENILRNILININIDLEKWDFIEL